MGFVVVFLLGLALGIGGTLGVRAVTDESTPSSRSEVREGQAEEWGEVYAECVEEAETPADDYFEEDDRTPAATTETERLECNRQADAVLRWSCPGSGPFLFVSHWLPSAATVTSLRDAIPGYQQARPVWSLPRGRQRS